MYLRTILIVLALGALALFTVANWQAFTTPTTLSLIAATVEAPLGLILLGVVVLLTALFLIYVVYLQSSALLETRRHARELHAQRELAEHAEISRINELRVSLESQLDALAKQNETTKSELLARLDQLEGDLRQSMEQCQNSLAAAMAEIDDRLERGIGQTPPGKLA
ncbi:MAG: LapA family protein [Deltaproteobacteria bacterium]|nr:LapA family protein [Deltaproteobacteria bacterium]MBI2182936.1 LapA family protein [Deltaproteobacteria bacterium]MBI2230099.1 LapA family protein [Deltaproteobacteria bacterium]MBI2364788.1 LapA family protein [Deltaproteobacteria bacterium]MBI2534199.1 LapA family protein [Deltaproteobacteria bacterium]